MRAVERTNGHLPQPLKVEFEARAANCLSVKEASRALGILAGAFKSRLSRTRQQLAQGLKRSLVPVATLLIVIAALEVPGFSQSTSGLQTFFRQDIGLSEQQITALQNGQPVTKNLKSRTPAEVFLFGAVYIHATPDRYLQFSHDFDRLRKLPNYLALGVLSHPPQATDLRGFSFESDDIKALKKCKPGDCLVQLPSSSIDELHRTVDWSSPNREAQVNELLRKTALE